MEALVALHEEVAGEGRWIAAELPIDRELLRERVRASIDAERAVRLVAVVGGDIVGQVTVEVTPYNLAYLSMWVAAGWRRRGIGTALVEAALAWARRAGAHKVVLEVWPHNGAALALYRKFGFVEEGLLRRHYPRRSGELWDVVVMGLVFDEPRHPRA